MTLFRKWGDAGSRRVGEGENERDPSVMIECPLCVRPCSWHWGLRNDHNKLLSYKQTHELMSGAVAPGQERKSGEDRVSGLEKGLLNSTTREPP